MIGFSKILKTLYSKSILGSVVREAIEEQVKLKWSVSLVSA